MMSFSNAIATSLVSLLILSCASNESKNTKISGLVFGTSYNVVYNSPKNYKKEFDSIFKVLNTSLSTYLPNSDISKLNKKNQFVVDHHFVNVYNTAKKVYNTTNGVFDPTIGLLVNAWDFGPEKNIKRLNKPKIDSLMAYVGFNNVLLKHDTIFKPKDTYIDFNAIAKGYAVDVISNFLKAKHCNHHLVEIGGEIRTLGVNIEKEKPWRVGVEKPKFDGTQSILKAITLTNAAMATSGTYRKFKIDRYGQRYAHIINTKTGYPSKTNLLSISVITNNCMLADAYATAFKAMGVKAVKKFLESYPDIKVFLIYEENNSIKTLSLNGFPES